MCVGFIEYLASVVDGNYDVFDFNSFRKNDRSTVTKQNIMTKENYIAEMNEFVGAHWRAFQSHLEERGFGVSEDELEDLSEEIEKEFNQ